eukprot:GDKH01002373.1.p1 GENE.GDKH01002373.1~~GDKH01002373.1.p1  ORF type:complete len:114 (-),score=24.95 GDKH01002373.1:487-828(-)
MVKISFRVLGLMACATTFMAKSVSAQPVPESPASSTPEPVRSVSSEDLAGYEKDFRNFDKNSDGLIDAWEVRTAFKQGINSRELFQFFMDVDRDSSGAFTLPEYVDYVIRVSS